MNVKALFLSLMCVLFFTGCTKNDIETQKKECQDQGKTVTAKKVFNHRNGEYEIRGECK